MTYCTQANFTDRFGEQELIQLTDRAIPPAGVVDTDVLDASLADADAEIDGYLAGRYSLPLASPPDVLIRLAADIARYRLYDNRATEEVRTRYADAIRFLERVSEGKVLLSAEPQPAAGAPEYSTPGRVFTADTLEDY